MSSNRDVDDIDLRSSITRTQSFIHELANSFSLAPSRSSPFILLRALSNFQLKKNICTEMHFPDELHLKIPYIQI